MTGLWMTPQPVIKQNMVLWKAAAYRPGDGMVIMEQGIAKSAQYAEVVAAMLAASQSLKEKQKVLHLFTDSCVANGTAMWSGKQKADYWKINGKDYMVQGILVVIT